jgi:hypothetical protein
VKSVSKDGAASGSTSAAVLIPYSEAAMMETTASEPTAMGQKAIRGRPMRRARSLR